jgi:hypothetical protein
MLAPKQIGLVSAIGDLATGGAIALGVGLYIEQHRALTVNQTTAGQVVTLPNPLDSGVVFSLDVHNVGSAPVSMYGVMVTNGASARFSWNGGAWSADVAPTATGATLVTKIPTAQNVVSDIVPAPVAGTSTLFFVNGALVPAGITHDAAGVITINPSVVGYNIEEFDVFQILYYSM